MGADKTAASPPALQGENDVAIGYDSRGLIDIECTIERGANLASG
jgi:hypothetical protein